MKKQETPIHTLWCRLLAGEELSDQEQTLLHSALKSDTAVRHDLAADSMVHALLLSLTDVRSSEDRFVHDVMMRCAAEEAKEVVSSEALTANFRNIKAGSSETLPVRSAPVIESKTSQSERTPERIPAKSESAFRQRKSNSLVWISLTLTALMFLGSGFLVWWDLSNVRPITQTKPPFDDSSRDDAPELRLPAENRALPPDSETTQSSDSIANLPPEKTRLDVERALVVNSDAGKTDVTSAPPERTEMPKKIMPDDTQGKLAQDVVRADGTFVTLTKVENPVWERSAGSGDRIGDEVIRLFGGTLELSFDDGAIVRLEGPIEFRPMSSGQLQLRKGRLTAAVPEKAIGFRVSTPTSEVVDLGTEFEVSVRETGASDVTVRKGEVEVMPAGQNPARTRKWRLVPDGLNQASFFERKGEPETSPVSAAVRGMDGAFQGMISINGRMVEFSSAEAFDDVRERVMNQIQDSRQDTLRQWSEFVDTVQGLQGTMNLNGAEVQFGNFEDMLKRQQSMMERMQAAGNPVEGNLESFSGSIQINGKVIQFRNREEYEAARRAAFGAAANFGAGDVLNPRRLRKKDR